MSKTANTVAAKLAGYVPDVNQSATRRLAELLRFLAKEIPSAFIEVQPAAKIAFALSKTPAAGSEYCGKKFQAVKRGANTILRRETGDYIVAVRYLGIRMTFDDDDKLKYPFRAARAKLEGVYGQMVEISSNIEASGLSPENRKEFSKINKALPLIEDFCSRVALLPKGEDEAGSK